MDEKELIQQARRGDTSAFNQLVLAYQQQIYNLAVRILQDDKMAEDVTQESFIAAFQALSGFRGGSFRAWVSKIAANRCLDEIRHKKRHPSQSIEMTNEEGEEIDDPAVLKVESDLPEESIERMELEKAILRCIEGLSVEFKTALLLVDVHGFDYKEASQVLHKPIGTLKSRLARARQAVQDCLQGVWELLPEEYRLKDEGSHE